MPRPLMPATSSPVAAVFLSAWVVTCTLKPDRPATVLPPDVLDVHRIPDAHPHHGKTTSAFGCLASRCAAPEAAP